MAGLAPLLLGGAGAVAGGVFGGPLGAGVGMAAGSALGGYFDGAYDTPDPLNPYPVDPSLYDPAEFNSISDAARQQAAGAGQRAAPTTDWGMSDADRALSMEARGRQMGLADDLEAFLRGERTSLAQQQLKSGMIRAQQGAANQAANVRGGAGNQLAAAQDATRASLIAGLQTNADQGQLRAQEEAAARGQLAGVLGQARGQDLGQRGQSQGQAEFGTQTLLQQQAQNDAQQRFYEQLRLQAAQAAAQTQQAQAAAQQGAAGAVQGINAQREQQAQDRKADQVAGLTQGGMGLATMGMQTAGKPQSTGSEGGGAPPTDQEWDGAWNANAPPTQDQWDTAWKQGGGRKWW